MDVRSAKIIVVIYAISHGLNRL